MTDLRDTIAPKSNQLNSDDLIGRALTIQVTQVSRSDAPDQPIAMGYDGDGGKPYYPCKSMRRVLVQVWGADGNAYVGRSLTLYRDDKVQFGGLAVGGIRISHMSDIKAPVTMALTATRANRKPFTVQPLVVAAKKRPPIDIARLRESLAACQTSEEVVAIGRHSRIVTALSTEPDDVRAEINALLAEAMERVQADDGSAANGPADEVAA